MNIPTKTISLPKSHLPCIETAPPLNSFVHTLGSLLFLSFGILSAHAQTEQPNIVILESDDHHFEALGSMGSLVSTPNLDSLAERGVLFRNNICQGTQCAPSRNSLLTGSYPHNTGIFHNRDDTMKAGVWTFPQALQRAGYDTALIGKDHFKPHTGHNANHPVDIKNQGLSSLGFDYVFVMDGKVTTMSNRNAPIKKDPYRSYLAKKGLLDDLQDDYQAKRAGGINRRKFYPSVLKEDDVQDAFITSAVIDWLDHRDNSQPFMLWVDFVSPHAPADPPEPYASMYDWQKMRKPIAAPQKDDASDVRPSSLTDEDYQRFRAGYYAMITALDAQIGRIIKTLEDNGTLDNTVIIFTSDQGSMIGDHDLWGKGNYYKGSVNSPLIIAGPDGRFQEGAVIDRPVELLDVASTVLELGQASAEDRSNSYGISLMPLLTGEGTYDRDTAFVEATGWKAAINKRYKYVRSPEGDVLFDLQEDPDEFVNLAEQHPEVKMAMSQTMDEWLESTPPVRTPLPRGRAKVVQP